MSTSKNKDSAPPDFVPQFPGDNPNLRNAKPRKFNRPRVKNTPPGEKPKMKYSWADPLPVVDPMPAIGIEENIGKACVGEVELDPILPERIAQPYGELVVNLGLRTNFTPEQGELLRNKLIAQAYFKACRQLYCTLLDSEKSKLQPLKAIYYDTTDIPKHMGSALTIIGDFDCKLGRVEVKHSTLLFRRWLVKGIQVDPDGELPEAIRDVNPFNLVWRDRMSKQLIDELCLKRLDELTKVQFNIDIPGERNPLVVTPPSVTEPYDAYFNLVRDFYPNAEEMRSLIGLLMLSERQWANGNPIIGNRDVGVALNYIHLHLAPPDLTDSYLRLEFEGLMKMYNDKAKHHLGALFNMVPPPAGEKGFPAQIVRSEDVTANWQMPISDVDLALGFAYSPSLSFKLNPQFVGYSKRKKEVVTADLAQRDVRSFAL